MSRRWSLALCATMLAASAQAYEIKDDAGVVSRFDTAPQRIVSLLPSLTETTCALGACARLVAVDRYANWPDQVKKLPQVGGGLDPNIEAIVALKPDVVLAATSSRAAVRLRALGGKVVQMEPRTGADMRRVVTRLGELLQVDGAPKLLQDIDAGVQAAAQSLPPGARGQRVYFEVSPAPHAAGSASFIGELLTALGLVNIIDGSQGPFPRINPEAVVRAAPDLIMASRTSLADMGRRPGWSALKALKAGRVCAFDAEQRDALVRPGPRMAEAARLIADCVKALPPATP